MWPYTSKGGKRGHNFRCPFKKSIKWDVKLASISCLNFSWISNMTPFLPLGNTVYDLLLQQLIVRFCVVEFAFLKFSLVWFNEVQKYCKNNFKQFQWLQFFSQRSNNINGCSCNFCTIYLCFEISSKLAAYFFYSQMSLN